MRMGHMLKKSILCVGAVFALTIFGGTTSSNASAPLATTRVISAPPGFAQACAKYIWLCTSGTRAVQSAKVDRSVLARVNGSVNAAIRPLDDRVNYGKNEFWTLPENGSGDCEDYALLKKKRLLERGVPASAMALAVVLDRRGNNHVVLIVRTGDADLVLDNLTSSIKSWNSTGYTFLARQSFENKRTWKVALAGPRAQQVAQGSRKNLARPAAAFHSLSFMDGR